MMKVKESITNSKPSKMHGPAVNWNDKSIQVYLNPSETQLLNELKKEIQNEEIRRMSDEQE
jgi:acylphosphatase